MAAGLLGLPLQEALRKLAEQGLPRPAVRRTRAPGGGCSEGTDRVVYAAPGGDCLVVARFPDRLKEET